MDESRFNQAADAMLTHLEVLLDSTGFDFEVKPGGVIEIEFDNGGKIIINRHVAAREIWIAAKSGGYHFKFENDAWVNTRDGSTLIDVLSRCMSAQAGVNVNLSND